MLTLSACSDLPIGSNDGVDEAAETNPIRQALASAGSVDDANRALDRKDYQRAYDILRQHLTLNPTDDLAKLSLARTYLGRNEGRNAQTILDSLSEDSKEAPRAHLLRGLALLVVGEREEAKVKLALAREKDETLWQAANGLGLIYDFEQQWGEAETSYKQALEQKPDAGVVHNNLGYSYLLQGRVEEATTAFSNSLSHEPSLDVARSNLRLALAAKGRYTDAVAGIDKAGLPLVLNNIGYVAMLRGDYESADIFFHRAIAESPVYYDTAEQNLERLKTLINKPINERTIRGLGN